MEIALLVFAVWLAGSYATALAEGWHLLAAEHPLTHKVGGRRWRLLFARLGLCWGLLTLGASDEGLVLVAFPLWRPGRRPVLIPWRHVRFVDGGSYWSTLVVGKPRITLRVTPYVADEIREYAGRAGPRPNERQ